MKPIPYFVVMIDHGRLGLEAIVQPELTRANIVDRVRSGEYEHIAFIQYVEPRELPEDITEDILREAGRLYEDEPVLTAVDLRNMAFDHARDLRKHEGVM